MAEKVTCNSCKRQFMVNIPAGAESYMADCPYCGSSIYGNVAGSDEKQQAYASNTSVDERAQRDFYSENNSSPEGRQIPQPRESAPSRAFRGSLFYNNPSISAAISRRGETDRIVSKWWVLAPLLAIMIFLMAFFSYLFMMMDVEIDDDGNIIGEPEFNEDLLDSMLASLSIFVVASMGVMLYPWYLQVKRRTEHFERDRLLRQGIIEAFESVNDPNISYEISTLKAIHLDSIRNEPDRSPVLYLLAVIFLLWLGAMYVLYVIMEDIYQHHTRQIAFMNTVHQTAGKLGITVLSPTWRPIPFRSFGMYFLLSCLCSCFGLWWQMEIIGDYNEHFTSQWIFEDSLMAS